MGSNSPDIQPSFTVPSNTRIANFAKHSANTTLLSDVKNRTTNKIISTSPVLMVKDRSENSLSGEVDNLFTWVFIACVVLLLLLIISLFMVVVCWKIRRRRRTATVTEIKKGAEKDRKRGRTGLRHSIKRVFVSDGPLYAVSNLNASRYTGIPEKNGNPSSESARSSMEIIISPVDNANHIPTEDQNSAYERYLSPIEGVPPPPAKPSSPAKEDDEMYLQPLDELRASKRFLQVSNVKSQETYFEPLHGLPLPDGATQKTSTPKPVPSPKPTVRPKP